MRNLSRLSPHDFLPFVNTEIAALGIGAQPLEYLNPGKNPIRCDDKKYKGSCAAYLNYGNNGQITNVSIHSHKEGGVKNRTIKSRDILQQGYSPRVLSSHEIESQRQNLARRKIAEKLATALAREKANATYHAALENGTTAYFERKQVTPAHGIRFDSTTAIIPACRFKQDSNSLEIAAIQQISENGQKLFNKNSEISGLFFPIGNRENPQQIYFVEGVATALSIHQSLDNPNVLVVVCFDSGNIHKVVTEFVRRYPMVYSRNGFILCADNDQWHENAKVRFAGFKAIIKTVAKFTNCLITYPDFYKSLAYLYEKHGIAKPTDFNDYAILDGAESVRWALSRQLLTAREFSQVYDVKSNALIDDSAQQDFLAVISANQKNRKWARFVESSLHYRYFGREFDEILKRVNRLRDEIRTNIATTNYPVARIEKQLQLVGRTDLLPQAHDNSESNQILDYELAAFRDNCYTRDFDNVQSLAPIYVTDKYLDSNKIAAPCDGETVFLCIHMGGGKTVLSSKWVVDSQKKKVLTISPRKALVQKIVSDYRATDIDVSHYQEEKFHNFSYGNKIAYQNLVTTLHSLHCFDNSDLDLIILDELAQTLRCFEGNLRNGDEIYRVFCDVVRKANRVVVNGADLTQKEIDFILNLRKGKPHRFYLKPNVKNSHVVLYDNEKQFDNKIFEAIAAGQFIIIPANSKTFIKNLAAVIHEKFPDCTLLAVHDENANDRECAAFLDNPNAEIDKYQVIMYSPVITSGVSFDELPNRKERVIFGYFSNTVGIASDAWQMLGRYRGDTNYHVCINAKNRSVDYHKNNIFDRALGLFEAEHRATNDFLRSEIAKNPAAHHGLISKLIEKGTLPNAPVENYLSIDEYSRFVFDSIYYTAKKQASFFDDFVKQAIAQGIKIEVDIEVSQNNYRKEGRELVKQVDLTGVIGCNESPINKTQYEKLKNQSRVSQQDTHKMRHFEIRDCLCVEFVDEIAHKFFDNGKGKKAIENLEFGNAELAVLDAAKTQSDHEKKTPLAQRKTRMLKRKFISKLQGACGVVVTETGVTASDEFFNVQHENVQSFLAWAWDNRSIINNLGFVKITKGFNENMCWFNKVAGMCGISMLSRQVRNSSGNPERFYAVNTESLQYASEILARRFARIHKKRLADLEQNIDAEIAEMEKTGAKNFSESFDSKSVVTHWT